MDSRGNEISIPVFTLNKYEHYLSNWSFTNEQSLSAASMIYAKIARIYDNANLPLLLLSFEFAR